MRLIINSLYIQIQVNNFSFKIVLFRIMLLSKYYVDFSKYSFFEKNTVNSYLIKNVLVILF